jgi:hypothetical protein
LSHLTASAKDHKPGKKGFDSCTDKMGSGDSFITSPQASRTTSAHWTASYSNPLVVEMDSQKENAVSSVGEGYQRLSADDESSWPPLLGLPVDILVIIYAQLPLASKACLAVTCKSFYRLFSSVLDKESLAWPRLLALQARDTSLLEPQPDHPRNELLIQLEDGHWLYCSSCLKLHPTTRFLPHSKSTRPILRYCGTKPWGIVDLCACLALTAADGSRLVKWLQTGACPTLHRSIRESFRIQDYHGRRLLLHTCSVTGHSDAFIGLVMEVTLDRFDSLVVTTRYHVRWATPHRLPIEETSLVIHQNDERASYNAPPVMLCPHLHALGWVYRHFIESWDCCFSCGTVPYLLGCTGDGLYWVVQGVRNLGGFDRWFRKSRIPYNAMLTRWYPSEDWY